MKCCTVVLLALSMISSSVASPAAMNSLPQNQKLDLQINLDNVDARVVLRLICDGAKLQLDMPDDIQRTVTVHLERPTLEEALKAILSPAGLTYDIQGGRLLIRRS